jgi:hypothetical protein
MCTPGWWIWCGDPKGASETNDTGLAKEQAEEIQVHILLLQELTA